MDAMMQPPWPHHPSLCAALCVGRREGPAHGPRHRGGHRRNSRGWRQLLTAAGGVGDGHNDIEKEGSGKVEQCTKRGGRQRS